MKTTILFTALLFSTQIFADAKIVEMNAPLTQSEIEAMEKQYSVKIELFDQTPSEFFQRTYRIEGEAFDELSTHSKVINVEPIFKAEHFSITPAKKSEFLTNDNLFHFQWGLYNQGQTMYKSVKTTRTEKIQGKSGIDIGWKSSHKQYEAQLKKTPLVAVIDMGVDYNHPDLKDQIYFNPIECPDGVIRDTEEDKDGNNLKGDCRGWNFAARNASEARRPLDDKSHGTHVAGIIAATSNNKTGVSGVSDKIKILPIRVTGKVDEDEDDRKLVQPLSDRIAKAILYATSKKVDVINLSLGWPKSLDTNYMRKAIETALMNGVVIVAAAGNNNTRGSILPCAYYDVVCVGALSIDGTLANFSNYGGDVDVLAPGDEIISTIPTDAIPLQLNTDGYDIKSGTSQAAPFVTALAALIKGTQPELTRDEVVRKILDSAEPTLDYGLSMHGLIRMDKALTLNTASPSVKPIFKNLSNLSFDLASGKLSFPFNVKNFGSEAQNIKVLVESLNPGVGINQIFTIEKLTLGQIITLKIDGQVLNILADQKVDFKVSVTVNDVTQVYAHEFTLSRDVLKDRNILVRKFKFADKPLPVAIIKDGEIGNVINTVEEYFPRTSPVYVMQKVNDELKQLEIKLLATNASAQIEEIPGTIVIPGGNRFLQILKIDLNLDGADDFLIRSIVCTENCADKKLAKRHIQYDLVKNDLSELIPGKSRFKFLPSVVNVNLKNMIFIPTQTEVGLLAIPYFIEEGALPPQQQEQGYFVKPDQRSLSRLYRLMPKLGGEMPELVTESVVTKVLSENLRKSYSHKPDENENVLFALVQSEQDYLKSKGEFLLSVGIEDLQRNYILKVENSQISINPAQNQDILGGYEHQDSLGLDGENKDTFVGFITDSRMQVIFQGGEYLYRADDNSEVPLSHIASFNRENDFFSFLQTPNYLMLMHGQNIISRKINRFSFLPGHIFNDTFYPIQAEVGGVNVPALYVDATQISTNLLSVTTVIEEQLVNPLLFSVFVPPICTAMNPYPVDGKMSFTLLCFDNKEKEWTLRYLPISFNH